MKRALVLSLICVLGFAFAGLGVSLTGSWDTDVTIDVTQTNFSNAIGLSSVLKVNYTVGDWTFTSITALTEDGWADQDFNAVGLLGAFGIVTALDLNPEGTFGDLDVTVTLSFSGVVFVWDVNLDATPDMSIKGTGVAGDVGIMVKLSFGGVAGCDFTWSKADVDLTFGFCCVDLKLALDFTCEGFKNATITFGGLVVPNLPWLTIDGSIVFDLDAGKTVTLTPSLDFGADVCFDLYWDLDNWDDFNQGFAIDSIKLDGFGISCEIGGVLFEGISYWGLPIVDDDGDGAGDWFPGILGGFYAGTAYANPYYEAYKISTTDDACCGPFAFSFAVYFDNPSLYNGTIDPPVPATDPMTSLFDVSLFVATVSLEVASQFTFDMGLTVDALGGFTEWTIGFLVTW
jgi:hypothetical protein